MVFDLAFNSSNALAFAAVVDVIESGMCHRGVSMAASSIAARAHCSGDLSAAATVATVKRST